MLHCCSIILLYRGMYVTRLVSGPSVVCAKACTERGVSQGLVITYSVVINNDIRQETFLHGNNVPIYVTKLKLHSQQII